MARVSSQCPFPLAKVTCCYVVPCFQQRSKGILLGVVGTDVPVKELLKTIPKYKVIHDPIKEIRATRGQEPPVHRSQAPNFPLEHVLATNITNCLDLVPSTKLLNQYFSFI